MAELAQPALVVGNIALVWRDGSPALLEIVSTGATSTVLADESGARTTHPTSEVQDAGITPGEASKIEPATPVPPHVERQTPEGYEIAPKVDSAEYLESGRGVRYDDPDLDGDFFGNVGS